MPRPTISPIPTRRPEARLYVKIAPAPMSVAQKNQIANNRRAAAEAARLRASRS